MRLSVRQQLCLILILSGCIGLAVLAIATWITNHDFVLSVSSKQLYTSASLKAAQVAFNLELMQIAATFVTTRQVLQTSLARYNNGSLTNSSDWTAAQADLEGTLGDVGQLSHALILQAEVFPVNQSGPAGDASVLNVTGRGADQILLPWTGSNGQQAHLGEHGNGYPPALYPNLTVSSTTNGAAQRIYTATYNGMTLGRDSTLVLGPLLVNSNLSLISITLPVINTTSTQDILGWVTALCDGRLISTIIQDRTGLGDSGMTLLVGPTNTTNTFPAGILNSSAADGAAVQYLLPLNDTSENEKRHPSHVIGTDNPPFPASAYPAVATALRTNARAIDDYGTLLESKNEENKSISAGYSLVPTDYVDWVVIVEMARDEVWQPINRLRVIILACLFSVMGFLFIVSFPIAHWFVLPIIRLRAATEQSIDPPHRASSSGAHASCKHAGQSVDYTSSDSVLAHKKGLMAHIVRWRKRKSWHTNTTELDSTDSEEKTFRIPGKVRERKQFITDEMSDLIKTFNNMSDELFLQYTKLEDRVKQRTIELEHSKKAAVAANESKTLFVANVSHELKTPLNGILGMCAVSMEEEDSSKLKRSMGIIYKSGDLLLRTLNDLLTFSTNQVGHQVLTLDEKDFNLRDMETQIFSIFSQQAKDNQIELRVLFEDNTGIAGLRDAILWGDIHRLLQVLINLTSNAIKFTPAGGRVTVVVRRLSETPLRRASTRLDKQRNRNSGHYQSIDRGTACFIDPHDISDVPEKTAAPPGKDMLIEFEVTDNGPGIPEDMQHRIFEPFVQGDAGLSRKHSGTGLGLSICSQLASLMKGSIDLRSKVGEGSTFTVKIPLRQVMARADSPKSSQNSLSRRSTLAKVDTNVSVSQSTPVSPIAPLPMAVVAASRSGENAAPDSQAPATKPVSTTPLKQAVRNATKEAKAKKEAKQDFSKIRVLVAEDNKVNQEVIIRMLKLEQIHDVTIAEDGQVALDLVKTKSAPADLESTENTSPYDIIFMDVQMPRMDGLTSTKMIRETGFKRPIVALTAFAEQSNIDECYGSGMDYFLAKPVKRPLLKKVLTEYCTPSPPDAKDETQDVEATSSAAVGHDKENATPNVQTNETEKEHSTTGVAS